MEDAEDRFQYYHKVEEKIPCKIDWLNDVTNGGVSNKTFNLIIAGTHGGKSAMMINLACNNIEQGKNVLYITLEMSEFEISKRIDANLFDIDIDDVIKMDRKEYLKNVNLVKSKSHGKFIIKEYPTASIDSRHIVKLLDELKLKKNFKPDVIYIDYLNLLLSSKLKGSAASNMYNYMKSISEEIRRIAVENNLPIWSATQFNRSGSKNEDADMADISESFAVNFICDFSIALINTEEMRKLNQILVKQLKNRYKDLNYKNKCILEFQRNKMKFLDIGVAPP